VSEYGYLARNAIALDQQVNALLGGSPDETLSARCHREDLAIKRLVNLLFFWQNDHCYQAYLSELYRKQLPKEYQK